MKKQLFSEISFYLIAIVLCLAILTWAMRLWQLDLSVPFSYQGDGIFAEMLIKSRTYPKNDL